MPVAVDSCWWRAAAMTLRGQCLVFVSDRPASPTSHGMEAPSPWSPPRECTLFLGGTLESCRSGEGAVHLD